MNEILTKSQIFFLQKSQTLLSWLLRLSYLFYKVLQVIFVVFFDHRQELCKLIAGWCPISMSILHALLYPKSVRTISAPFQPNIILPSFLIRNGENRRQSAKIYIKGIYPHSLGATLCLTLFLLFPICDGKRHVKMLKKIFSTSE